MPACLQRVLRCATAAGLIALCALVARRLPAQEFIRPATVFSSAAPEEVAVPPSTPLPPISVEPGLLSDGFAAGLECESCGSMPCVPGRTPCPACEGHTRLGRFLCAVYQNICCPDPCYDPCWLAIADTALFTPAARPRSQQRIRWDAARNIVFPDRAEYFWARA